MTKYIFVTGGVVSSVGKGISVASIGRILKSRGISVSIQKLDPYLNVDPGTMSPYQHGEVFVTEDGSETDLDLGHYERFIDVELSYLSNITAGQIYSSVITKERRGDFLGGTIQAVPHVTNEIKDRIKDLAADNNPDVIVVEVGGTVGDIEGLPFLETIRQMRNEVGRDNVYYIHVTFLPYISSTGELKTKPTQHSVKELRGIGVQPDAIICRSDHPVSEDIKSKIALFCDVQHHGVIPLPTVSNVYEVPLILEAAGMGDLIVNSLGLTSNSMDISDWRNMVEHMQGSGRPPEHSGSGQVRRPPGLIHIGEGGPAPRRAPTRPGRAGLLGTLGGHREGRRRAAPQLGQWHSRARRLWHPRDGGHDSGGAVRTGAQSPVPWALPWDADDGGGDGPPRPQLP